MTLICPDCHTEFDGRELGGLAVVHCPSCGRGFEPHAIGEGAQAAWAGPTRTSRLAIFALVAGIGSMVAPFCACPVGFLFLGATARPMPAPVVVPPARAVPVAPTRVTTVTLPDGTTTVVPVAPPAAPTDEEIVPEDDAGAGEDAGGSQTKPGGPGGGGGG